MSAPQQPGFVPFGWALGQPHATALVVVGAELPEAFASFQPMRRVYIEAEAPPAEAAPAPAQPSTTAIEPGSPEHLYLLGVPWHLNLLYHADAEHVQAYGRAVWAAAESACKPAWRFVHTDGHPACDKEQVYIGVNSNGFACAFNGMLGDTCVMHTPEETIELMSDLQRWYPLDLSGLAAATAPAALQPQQEQAVPFVRAPHPQLQDALFCYATGDDGASAELIRGWSALVARVASEVAGDGWEEALADLDEWSNDGWGVPYRYSVSFEDGYMAIYRIAGDEAASVAPQAGPVADADRQDAEAYRRINTPEVSNFLAGVHNEALHQRERWGAEGDAGKTDADWYWLVGYLAGKAIRPDATPEKRLHHIITTAAALLNWHAARVGAYAAMRPGIDPAAHGIADDSAEVPSHG